MPKYVVLYEYLTG